MLSPPQIITDPHGGKLAVIPLEEYQRMREWMDDLEDGIAAAAIQKRIAVGEEETFPAALVARLLDGEENKVKVWREYRGLTIRQLADQAGCGPDQLAAIESGEKEGSLPLMKAVARVLNIDMDDLA